jgi:hypothetical protein
MKKNSDADLRSQLPAAAGFARTNPPLAGGFFFRTLPPGWTNDSLGIAATYLWEFTNPVSTDYSGAGFDTSFVILDSDHYGQGATQLSSLTTDTFSAAGFSGLTLELDEQYFPTVGNGILA